jgi:hypothetical protein
MLLNDSSYLLSIQPNVGKLIRKCLSRDLATSSGLGALPSVSNRSKWYGSPFFSTRSGLVAASLRSLARLPSGTVIFFGGSFIMLRELYHISATVLIIRHQAAPVFPLSFSCSGGVAAHAPSYDASDSTHCCVHAPVPDAAGSAPGACRRDPGQYSDSSEIRSVILKACSRIKQLSLTLMELQFQPT